jgi:hypothetical protein
MAVKRVSARDNLSCQPQSSPSVDPLAFLYFMSGSGTKQGRVMHSPIALDVSPVSSPKNQIIIVDLRSLVVSRTESLKRHFELCHTDVLKEFDASQVRISKHYKTQLQACFHLT